jgi:phosphoketolase
MWFPHMGLTQVLSLRDQEPDIVMCGIGDVVTAEALAATALLRENLPELKIRFVNVVDLFRLVSRQDHPHGEYRVVLGLHVLVADHANPSTRPLGQGIR